MAPEEKAKAIKGVLMMSLLCVPFACVSQMKLSPEAVRASQQVAQVEPTSDAKADDNDTDADGVESEAQRIADGTNCVGGLWDNTLPALNDAVKEQLRNPSSFEHVRTVWTPTGRDGKFSLIMTYRAQNGFGGMNIERVGAVVDAKTCDFKFASATTLLKRFGKLGRMAD